MKNKILFFMAAGNGDLINFTGPLLALKHEYPHLEIDFLCLKKHAYVLEGNPAVSNVLIIDNYDIPIHCRQPGHAEKVIAIFVGQYEKIINAWAVDSFKRHGLSERHADFITLSMHTLRVNGFPLRSNRKECQAQMFFSDEDRTAVDQLVAGSQGRIAGRPLALIENESFSWKSPAQKIWEQTQERLRHLGYATVGNGHAFEMDISSLNLKQVKDLFNRHCQAFAGVSSGMSCSIYSGPTDFGGKRVAINGLYPSWNLSPQFTKQPDKYLFGMQAYTLPQIDAIFG